MLFFYSQFPFGRQELTKLISVIAPLSWGRGWGEAKLENPNRKSDEADTDWLFETVFFILLHS